MAERDEAADDAPQDRERGGGYEVGYCRPPKHSRFKPGERSPNPQGRPKGARSFATDLKEVLKLPVEVTEGGKTKRVSTQRGGLLRLRERALKGNERALDRLLALAAQHNGDETAEVRTADLLEEDREILANARARQSARPAPSSGGSAEPEE